MARRITLPTQSRAECELGHEPSHVAVPAVLDHRMRAARGRTRSMWRGRDPFRLAKDDYFGDNPRIPLLWGLQ